ncbi:MAG: hypothetical protein KDA45_10310 [Planctomycetales bacterium]|nr:hypothetical protein [Planctomycetales bacterium]
MRNLLTKVLGGPLASRCWVACSLWLITCAGQLGADEVKVWEFSPYEVEVWYSFDASVDTTALAQQEFVRQLQADLERTFRAAWQVRLQPMTAKLSATVDRNFNDFTIQDIAAGELVLVVSSQSEQSKTIRTLEAALQSLTAIPTTYAAQAEVQAAVSRLGLPSDSTAQQLCDKCEVDEGGMAAIEEKLQTGSIAAALLPRSLLPRVAEQVRPLVTLLPWQTDSLFRQRDKLFFLKIGMQGDSYTFHARELDCPMQYLGPGQQEATTAWSYASRMATTAIVHAFAPVARVEEAESRTASLRLRAGGLIVDERNPAAVQVGEVLHPIVRRDDRHGIPTLLEPLAWTFAAVTASDGVQLQANVYTYSGGPGLQGRQNRRTQRVLLRVRPVYDKTDIRVVIRGDNRPQAGCMVYQRDLLSDEFTLLGRTDWRGRFTISSPADYGGFLPDAVRYQRALAQKEAEARAAAAELAAAEAAAKQDGESAAARTGIGDAGDGADRTELPAIEPLVAAEDDPARLSLRAPLIQIYIKSGDEVLAKLPMVPGLEAVATAALRDDSRRLKAEAFVRGFQNEILDLIGLRNLLAARIRLHLDKGKLEAAEKVLAELRGLRNYSEMSDELVMIQRRMMDESDGPIPLTAKHSMDRMFQRTRNMLQKYMQDNVVADSEQAVAAAQ